MYTRIRYENVTEQELIQLVIHYHEGATQTFLTRYQALIYSLLQRMEKNAQERQEREDLFQYVCQRLWDNDCHCLRQWDGRGSGRFSAFLRVIVPHIASDYRRYEARKNPRNLLPMEEEGEDVLLNLPYFQPSPEQMIFASERQACLFAVLQQLSQRDAELLRRKYCDEQNCREIASALGMSVNNVGVALKRARIRCSKHLCQQYPEWFASYLTPP